MSGYTLELTEYEPVLVRPDTNTDSVEPVERGTHTLTNVVNIELDIQSEFDVTRVQEPQRYHFPTVHATRFPSESQTQTPVTETYTECTPTHVSQVDTAIQAVVIGDEYESDKTHSLTYYDAFGVWTEPYVNTFGTTKHPVTLFVPSGEKCDEPFTRFRPQYRGIRVTYPHGEHETFGDCTRHSQSARQKLENSAETYTPPVSTDSNSFTVVTDKGAFSDVVNVRQLREDSTTTYALQRGEHAHSIEYVSDIMAARGGAYTVCVKVDADNAFTDRKYTIKSYRNLIGVYRSEDASRMLFLGHPESICEMYQTPTVDGVCVDDVVDMHVKTPSGSVCSEIPDYIIHGATDIPCLNTEDSEHAHHDISTELSKVEFTTLIISRLSNTSFTADAYSQDYQAIIAGYPELEPVFNAISTPSDLETYNDLLPFTYTPEERALIQRYTSPDRPTPSLHTIETELTNIGQHD